MNWTIGRSLTAVALGVALFGSTATAATKAKAKKGPAPISEASPVEKQNRVNRDYFERVVAGPNGSPGVWLAVSGSGSGIRKYTHDGEGFASTASFVTKTGSIQQVPPRSFRPDKNAGTIVIWFNGAPHMVAQLEREPDGAYVMRYLPGLDVRTEQQVAGSVTRIRFVGTRMVEVHGSDPASVYEWRPEPDASVLQASVARKVQAETAARNQAAAEERARAYIAALEDASQGNQEEIEADLEADAQAKASAVAASWNANQGQSAQALADSLQNLNNTVSNIQAQQRVETVRQHDVQRQPDQSPSASLEVSSTSSTAAIAAPTQTATSTSNLSSTEHLMGFLGMTCEVAIENASRHFGKGSSFRVAHSRPDGSMCLIQVDLDSVVRGASGTASGQ